MDKLFGTDGIRGVANEYPMTPEMAVTIGRAIAIYFKGEKIVIAKDTRISGDMIESAIISGICSSGVNPFISGILPTPGVAFLTRSLPAAAGVMISASHNPFFDNGIKIFKSNGFKLSDEEEAELEQIIKHPPFDSPPHETGKIQRITDADKQYVEFLKRTMPRNFSLRGMKIVLDCSNGATYAVAPKLFSDLGAEVETMFTAPDGKNINANCGSQHPEHLAKKVLQKDADIGLAFDGDGDRLIAVDEKGKLVSGDQILVLCAKILKQNGKICPLPTWKYCMPHYPPYMGKNPFPTLFSISATRSVYQVKTNLSNIQLNKEKNTSKPSWKKILKKQKDLKP